MVTLGIKYVGRAAYTALHGSLHDAPRFFFAPAGRAFRSRAGAGNGKREAAGSSWLMSAEHHGGFRRGGEVPRRDLTRPLLRQNEKVAFF